MRSKFMQEIITPPQKCKSLLALVIVVMMLATLGLSSCSESSVNSSGSSSEKDQSKKVAGADDHTLTPKEARQKYEEERRRQEDEEMAKVPTFEHGDTLEGTDADNDGVRDDIQAYIDGLDLPPTKKEALKKIAMKLAKTMKVDVTNDDELQELANELGRAITCYLQGISAEEYSGAHRYLKIIKAATANTRARTEKYNAFNLALSGRTFTLPTGDACDEDE